MENRPLGPSADDKSGPLSKLFGGSEMAAGYMISSTNPWDGRLDNDSSGTAIVVM